MIERGTVVCVSVYERGGEREKERGTLSVCWCVKEGRERERESMRVGH